MGTVFVKTTKLKFATVCAKMRAVGRCISCALNGGRTCVVIGASLLSQVASGLLLCLAYIIKTLALEPVENLSERQRYKPLFPRQLKTKRLSKAASSTIRLPTLSKRLAATKVTEKIGRLIPSTTKTPRAD